ncbi:MAG: ABC-F family ATP-binding cassette domain-containing protein, partial [Bdellovibrionales bacterium]|nr:ABC-F family ATP-binding cassette domain-containing protein [Bdellovibrionales bacterium]
EENFARPLLELSGGYRMRIKLLGLLGNYPNLLLMDEPTNYLDLETTLLLENFLQSYDGAFLLISHDREFLRRTTDHTLEVEAGDVTKFNGNIDDYFEQKSMLREQLLARARSFEEKKKDILDFVARFGAKATKARQAQSRMKSLAKMEIIEVKSLPVSAQIRIPKPVHVGKTILTLGGADLGYKDRTIVKAVDLELKRGDHIAVVGLNGAGKSTLLKSLAGTLPLKTGERELGMNVELAIFNQHVVEVLEGAKTILESVEGVAHSEVTLQEIKDLLGSLLFSGDDIRKKISVLSGGEKSRVALAQILVQRVPLLLLDEPTNHLDFQTVEALTQALKSFAGSFVVVSHDRSFIGRVAKKIIEVSDGEVNLYPGSYDEYVWSLQQRLLRREELSVSEASSVKSKSTKTNNSEKILSLEKINHKEKAKLIRSLERQLKALEEQIEKNQNLVMVLNENLASGSGNAEEDIRKLAKFSAEIEEWEGEWMRIEEERSRLLE